MCETGLTAYARCWSDGDVYGGFFGQFVSSLYFDWAVDAADDGVAVAGVGGGAICTV